MSDSDAFILGEFRRTFDERYRISLPQELLAGLAVGEGEECLLAKERPGCLSLWNRQSWQAKWDAGLELVQAKMRAGRLDGRMRQVQMLGRLMSTRHRPVALAGRGRLIVPEGFREFLGVEPGHEVLVVGAGVCVEIWRPAAWCGYLERRIAKFGSLLDRLSS